MWDSILNALWYTIVVFCFLAYLMVLFWIIMDLFRDRGLSGGWKAVWMIFLIVFPWLTAIVYLIARGKGMSERSAAAQSAAVAATDDYIRSAAGSPSPAAQIADAKALLDSGTITDDEFASLKAKALA